MNELSCRSRCEKQKHFATSFILPHEPAVPNSAAPGSGQEGAAQTIHLCPTNSVRCWKQSGDAGRRHIWCEPLQLWQCSLISTVQDNRVQRMAKPAQHGSGLLYFMLPFILSLCAWGHLPAPHLFYFPARLLDCANDFYFLSQGQ